MSKTKKGVVIMGHGSKRQAANIEFTRYAEQVAAADTAGPHAQQYQFVRAAFLELSPPTLMQSCEVAVAEGCTQIDVYPLFLNQGRHVEKDIPQQVAEVMERFDNITVRLLNYMGSSPELTTLVLNHLLDQQADH
jgi:sirohydrochlorin cobaltochelatase